MVGYGIWQYISFKNESNSEEKRLLDRASRQSTMSIFLGAVSLLILLDLAGDATEVLTIVFVAKYSNALLVFLGAVTALIAAAAVETILGNRLGRYLSQYRLRLLSLIVFLVIGSFIIITSFQ